MRFGWLEYAALALALAIYANYALPMLAGQALAPVEAVTRLMR